MVYHDEGEEEEEEEEKKYWRPTRTNRVRDGTPRIYTAGRSSSRLPVVGGEDSSRSLATQDAVCQVAPLFTRLTVTHSCVQSKPVLTESTSAVATGMVAI